MYPPTTKTISRLRFNNLPTTWRLGGVTPLNTNWIIRSILPCLHQQIHINSYPICGVWICSAIQKKFHDIFAHINIYSSHNYSFYCMMECHLTILNQNVFNLATGRLHNNLASVLHFSINEQHLYTGFVWAIFKIFEAPKQYLQCSRIHSWLDVKPSRHDNATNYSNIDHVSTVTWWSNLQACSNEFLTSQTIEPGQCNILISTTYRQWRYDQIS
jgi:hypothetical protein